MLTLLAFVFAISLLVFIHEYGHYWVARQCGVGVLTFSIGFGKPVFKWQRGETTWQIAMIPLGGYVRMLDENEQALTADERQRAFNRQHPLKKIAVVFAGPLANFIFAVIAFALCYGAGVPTLKPHIASVQVQSMAARSGFEVGDQVLSIANTAVESWDQLQLELLAQAGEASVPFVLQKQDGSIRHGQLPLGQLKPEQFDQQMLARVGISPFSSLNVIGVVQENSPAQQAGLRIGDEIVAINHQAVNTWQDVQRWVVASSGRNLELTIKRGAEVLTLRAAPALEAINGQQVARLGIVPKADLLRDQQQVMTIKLDPLAAIQMGVMKTYQMSLMTLRMFGKMLTGVLSPKQISGPIGIADYAGQSAAIGWMTYVQFLALISISLGVLNLLPVPILDGGHLLYHSYELVTGRIVPDFVTEWLQKIGLSLLLMLMALALYNDTSRFLLG
ncbi:RIP metalloprotease RseP [Chitinibacter sp. GC72]|uniref:RIP metalloprotease RseP n=1 Tax=Chitinibacter sp. GC72 TaxID=1526917 RepID=UPI0012FC5C78|nr:RIP metalloprotease RseP [Chitinibacter sp. GC72]